MKHGTIIVFRHAFGQMLEDNVESPNLEDLTELERDFLGLIGALDTEKESLEYKISCNACCRVGSVTEKTPHAINIAVFRWRQRSLQLARGETAGAAEPCPTAKHVPPDLSDADIMWMERARQQQMDPFSMGAAVRPVEHLIPIIYRRHAPVEIISSRARAFAMLGGFRRPHYEVEIIQDCVTASHQFLVDYLSPRIE